MSLPVGTIVIADEQRPLGILFDRTAEEGASEADERILLAAIAVRGVPDMALEEVYAVAASALRA